MTRQMFIAGDWGSTSMRLHLCERDGADVRAIETLTGPGIKFCGGPEDAFFAVAGGWLDREGSMPIVLAGMVGSNVGWVDTAYTPCPATIGDVAARMTAIAARGQRIWIVPGLSATSIFGLPDVMRGEEAQLFGWLAGQTGAAQQVVCLPGTHAKWAIVEGDRVVSFFTSMTGELFEILVAHSLVGRGMPPVAAGTPVMADDPGFSDGLDTALANPGLAFEHAVFSARSRVVTGGMSADRARAYLSGLVIGCEVRDSVAAHRAAGIGCDDIPLIATAQLTALYGAALDRLGIRSTAFSGADASLRGLGALVDETTVTS